jgi:twitching motility two-component system response regulator PilG
MVSEIKPKILAVDDSVVMQDLIRRALETEYEVITVGSAIEALAVLSHEKIATLLLDISMPGIDGLDLCRTIRAIPNFSNLPVIMVTGKDTVMDKVQGRIAGATEYLTKPFDAQQLRQLLGRLAGASLLPEVPQIKNLESAENLIDSEN